MNKQTSVHLVEHFTAGYALKEAQVDRDGGVLQNVALLGRVSANKRRYTDRAMTDAVRLFAGAKVFLDHATNRELRERDGNRSVRDLVGRIMNPRIVGDQVRGDVHVLKGPDGDRVFALAEQMPDVVGHSQHADGLIRKDRTDNTVVVEALTKLHSIDLVTNPATVGGLFESVIDDSTGEKTMDLKTLKAEHADIVEQIRAELAEEAGADSDNAKLTLQVTRLEEEKKALATEVDTLKTEKRASEHKALVAAQLAEAKLPDRLVSEFFRAQLEAAEDEKTVKALIEDRRTLGQKARQKGPESHERIIPDDDDVPVKLTEEKFAEHTAAVFG